MKSPAPLTEDDILLIETLVKSPVFGSLKKLLDAYRFECMNELMTCIDSNKLFEIRGRIIGANVVENLPQIRAQMAEKQRKEIEEKDKKSNRSLTARTKLNRLDSVNQY